MLDGFASLGLNERLIAALTTLGYEEPTAIQREAIPPLLAGKDVLGKPQPAPERRRRSRCRYCIGSATGRLVIARCAA